jgi:hypothetical protein
MAQHTSNTTSTLVILAASGFPLEIIKCGHNNGNNKGITAPVRAINNTGL